MGHGRSTQRPIAKLNADGDVDESTVRWITQQEWKDTGKALRAEGYVRFEQAEDEGDEFVGPPAPE